MWTPFCKLKGVSFNLSSYIFNIGYKQKELDFIHEVIVSSATERKLSPHVWCEQNESRANCLILNMWRLKKNEALVHPHSKILNQQRKIHSGRLTFTKHMDLSLQVDEILVKRLQKFGITVLLVRKCENSELKKSLQCLEQMEVEEKWI